MNQTWLRDSQLLVVAARSTSGISAQDDSRVWGADDSGGLGPCMYMQYTYYTYLV